MKYILIIYLLYNGPTMQRVDIYNSKPECEHAGEAWVLSLADRPGRAYYSCIPGGWLK